MIELDRYGLMTVSKMILKKDAEITRLRARVEELEFLAPDDMTLPEFIAHLQDDAEKAYAAFEPMMDERDALKAQLDEVREWRNEILDTCLDCGPGMGTTDYVLKISRRDMQRLGVIVAAEEVRK